MPNTQVTRSASPNNARSESNIEIGPDGRQIIAGSKRFRDLHDYDFTLATAYSGDRGATWNDSADLPVSGPGVSPFTILSDPALAWGDTTTVYLVALTCNDPPVIFEHIVGIVVYRSTDGGRTWSQPQQIHLSTSDDKPWAAGDSNPGSPRYGNVYAVWDDTPGLRFARTTDHGLTWTGSGGASPGTVISTGLDHADIDVSDDGTIYVTGLGVNGIAVLVSADGGDTFRRTATDPATDIISLPDVLPGGTFRTETLPTACVLRRTVTMAWADFREGMSRIYYAQSTDGGANWWTGTSGRPLLTTAAPNLHHFHPQIVTDARGVLCCAFYEFGPKPTSPLIDVVVARSFDGGATFEPATVTDQPWDPAVGAPDNVEGVPSETFIGDYFGLDVSDTWFHPLWTDTRTGTQELFTARVPLLSLRAFMTLKHLPVAGGIRGPMRAAGLSSLRSWIQT
jgi:hypothetical protein